MRRVIVRFRAGFGMGSPSLSTSSSSSESESSEDESEAENSDRTFWIGGGGMFLFGCGRSVPETTETVDARFLPAASTRRVSAVDGGRNEGTGEFARLRACASLNAATDILWEESDATLSPLGRGRGGGGRREFGKGSRECSGGDVGESGRMWRKPLRLKDDEWSVEGVEEGRGERAGEG